MVKDFSDIEENSFYEILVIGAGAAGITLSLELENSKYKVALIEAGNLKNNIENQQLMEMETDGPLKHSPLETVRARQFGGTTNLWGAGLVKYDEIDFIDRPNINIDGWPINFAEIEPYYQRAKKYLKVSKESFSNNSMLNSINDKFLNNDVVEQKNILRHKSGSNFRKMYLDRFQKSDNITLFLNSTLSDISINNKNIKYVKTNKKISAPGQSKLHYSPGIPIKLNVTKSKHNEAFILINKRKKSYKNYFYLSKNKNLKQAAKNLYKILRIIKNRNYKSIVIEKIPNIGIGETINDRLKRASAK